MLPHCSHSNQIIVVESWNGGFTDDMGPQNGSTGASTFFQGFAWDVFHTIMRRNYFSTSLGTCVLAKSCGVVAGLWQPMDCETHISKGWLVQTIQKVDFQDGIFFAAEVTEEIQESGVNSSKPQYSVRHLPNQAWARIEASLWQLPWQERLSFVLWKSGAWDGASEMLTRGNLSGNLVASF